MRKAYLVLLVILLALAIFGCKSAGQKRMENDPNVASFVADPPTDKNYIFGVGGSKLTNNTRAVQASDAQARTDIATKLKTEVQAMIIDYFRSAGTENNQASLNFYESISRQLTDAYLTGVDVVKREKTKDGTYWTLMRISKTDAASAAANAIQDVYESEAARYAEFKAMDALKMMEQQLNK